MSDRDIYLRRTASRLIREEAATLAFLRPHPDHVSNGEELAYRRSDGNPSYMASHSKGLPHNAVGEVHRRAYERLLAAFHSGDPALFERIPMGTITKGLDLTNPQAGLAFDLEGPDAQATTIPPAPRVDAPEVSGEMGELYWMALLRDVSFTKYGVDPGVVNTTAAAASLTNEFSDFKGPKVGGAVTTGTLFRGFTPDDTVGPFVSQFLLKGTADPILNPPPDSGFIKYGTLRIDQRQQTAQDHLDYLTTFGPPPSGNPRTPNWLDVQNGRLLFDLNVAGDKGLGLIGSDKFDPKRRFIRNLRDLTTYVHFDALYEAYLNACLLLLAMPARLDPGNPYVRSRTQDGFGTFGGPHILTLVTEVATRALKAAWFQKWGVHRRLRPEEFGGRVHVHRHVDPGRYPMIDGEILASSALAAIEADPAFGGASLLPQAFPEGCPAHPSYGSGHATVAGACVTILKAWFDEGDVFDPAAVPPPDPAAPLPLDPDLLARLQENRRPKVPNTEGTELINYDRAPGEPPLTVGGELNKLAANISIARNAAGVHWRSDYTSAVLHGEEIAIRLLEEQRRTYNEHYQLSLTRFNGTAITI